MLCLYILLAFFSTAGGFAFADGPNSALDDKPSVDTAAVSGAQIPAVPSDAAAADTHTNYLYDLKKLIEKSRENIKEVNQKIKEQAVLKRNQKREERAREYYEKGAELTNEGKLDEARDYFEKAIRITEHPEMAGYIKESQRRLKKQENALQAQEREHYNQIKKDESTRKVDVEAAYKEAVDFYKQKKYHPAKDAFEHVDEIAPDYRATGSYLKMIDQDIVMADALAVKQQAVEIAHQQKEAESARVKEKATWLAQIDEKEKQRKEAINKQAEDVYTQAVELYKNKKFAEAKKKFEEVIWVIPDYKAAMKYLGRIDRDAQEEQERAARQQQKALQEQRWEEEVERKKQEDQRQHELKAKELQHMKDLQDQAQFLYTAAVNLFNNKAMDEALEKFNDIEKLYPGFRSTRMYIARVGQWKFDQQKRLLESQEIERKKQEARRQHEDLELKKQEAQRQRELEAKERQHKRDIQEQAQSLYTAAVGLFDRKNMDEALEKFNNTEKLSPDFKSTRIYIARIEQWKLDQQKQLMEAQADQLRHKKLAEERQQTQELKGKAKNQRQQELAAERQRTQELKEKAEELRHKKLAEERRRAQELKDKTDQASKIYTLALQSYRDHHWEESKAQFKSVEKMIPDFKQTRRYLQKVDDFIAREAKVKPAVVKIPAVRPLQHPVLSWFKSVLAPSASAPKPAVTGPSAPVHSLPLASPIKGEESLEDQQKQAQDIAALAAKSAQLYRQIADIADDRSTAQTKRKMAEVNGILNNLKENKERLLRQMREEQSKRQQEERRAEAQKMYQDGREYLRSHDYAKAKVKFLALENITPDYKATRRYLSRIEKYQKQAGVEALTAYEQKEAERLKQLQDKENAEKIYRFRKEEEARQRLEQQQQATLKGLAQKASAINDDIIRFSAQRDYGAMKAKFAELENTVAALTTLKRERQRQKKKGPMGVSSQAIRHQVSIFPVAWSSNTSVNMSNATTGALGTEKATTFLATKQSLITTNVQSVVPPAIRSKQEQAQIDFSKLEARRKAVRKQLEDGVEAMYQEALSLYKQGHYTAAVDKFKDVQDILPGYKRAGQYMDEARQKSLTVTPQPVITPGASAVPSSSLVSREDSVSKVLDLFESNKKGDGHLFY